MTATLTCAIIDDEPLAVKLLESYVEKTPFLTLQASWNSGTAALYDLQTHPVDLLFLDIQMPELDGLDFARLLSPGTSIVFTTAFSLYALDSYKVNAVDYLLKPVSYADFLSAAQKVLDIRTVRAEQSSQPLAVDDDKNSFFVKSDYKLVRVYFADILYIEGLKDYVKIYLADGSKPLLSLASMKAVEDFLPADRFLRVHRSFIVNMAQVKVMERGQIVFGERRITVSDSYRDRVQAYVSERLLSGR